MCIRDRYIASQKGALKVDDSWKLLVGYEVSLHTIWKATTVLSYFCPQLCMWWLDNVKNGLIRHYHLVSRSIPLRLTSIFLCLRHFRCQNLEPSHGQKKKKEKASEAPTVICCNHCDWLNDRWTNWVRLVTFDRNSYLLNGFLAFWYLLIGRADTRLCSARTSQHSQYRVTT